MRNPGPVPSSVRWLEEHVINPVLRWLLRSPLHGLVSNWFLLVSYEGHTSGRRIRTPVAYERDGRDVVVVTFRETVVWWRNFRDGHPATLWLDGRPVETRGRAVTDPGAVADWLDELADRGRTRLLKFLDVPTDAPTADLESAAEGLVVVRFTPD
jgi:hypothetical protein